MPPEARSNARTFLSALVGMTFTLHAFVFAALTAGRLLDALMAGHPKAIRVGILAAAFTVSACWAYIGGAWISEDLADLRNIDNQHASGTLIPT